MSYNLLCILAISSIFLLVVEFWPNHTSHRKVQFNEFVENSLCCDMGTIIFDLHGYGGC